MFGLSVIAGVSNDSIFKGLIAACLGLFMTTIGVDSISGTARFLFGQKKLMAGIDLIIALIGMFAISEILTKSKYDPKTDHKIYDPKALTKDKITKEEYRRNARHWRRFGGVYCLQSGQAGVQAPGNVRQG